MALIWMPTAQEDLRGIWEFYSQRSPWHASKIVLDVRNEAKRLEVNPRLCPVERLLEELGDEYRSMVVRRQWKVVYRLEGDDVFVWRVFDCRQSPEKINERTEK